MLHEDDVLAVFSGLEALGLRRPVAMDTADAVRTVARLWVDALPTMDAVQLGVAIRVHIAHPERGRWWPVPADLVAAAGAIAPARLAEATWDAMIQRIAAGKRTVGDLLTPTETAALATIGGTWAIGRAEAGVELASLRRRWLDHVATAETSKVLQLVAPPEDRAVTDRIRGMLGTGDDLHAARRERANAQGRGE